jgi:hypothetical protein
MEDSLDSEAESVSRNELKLERRRERNLYDTKTTRKGLSTNAHTRPLAASSLVKQKLKQLGKILD